MESKYILPIAIILFLVYSAYTTTPIDIIYYIAFMLLGVYFGQEFNQIPNIKKVIQDNSNKLK